MSGITLRPLVLSVERFAFLAAVGTFLLLVGLCARRTTAPEGLGGWGTITLLAGVIAARLAHVAHNLDVYAQDPISVLAFWQGGFDAWIGLTVAALVLAGLALRRRERVAAVLTAASLAGLLVWQAILHAAPAPDMPLPEARFAALDGAPQTLQGEGSGPVVVNLWATWCPPCRRELPMMMDLAEATPAVRVVFLNQGEFGPHVQQYLLREGLSSDRVLLDPETKALTHFNAPGLPATLFFSSEGVLEELHLGEISRAAFRSRLQSLR
jgi:thiol-disulfide isomerase/thioredoxin